MNAEQDAFLYPQKTVFPKVSGRILVVDDQAMNIQVVGGALSALGHEIVPATDGATALKRLSYRLPDLILLDILMPGMDGFEVCAKIKENPDWAELPIIFLSAADDKSFIVKALEAGGVDYITKPFNHAELICRVNTHLELKFTRDRLARIAQDKEEIYGIMAHDCKSLLGGIHMTSELLLEKVRELPDKTLTKLVQNIENSSGQMLRFVRQFLANASWENNNNINLQHIDIRGMTEKLISLFHIKAEHKNIALNLKLPPDPIYVKVDPLALEQIFNNLISNAIKFSPFDKKIDVRFISQDKEWICEIQDQGPGFTPEDLSKMFRRYTRLSAKPTAGEPSTGLGLSIVKKLTDAMHIKLVCESPTGGGTKFILRFQKINP